VQNLKAFIEFEGEEEEKIQIKSMGDKNGYFINLPQRLGSSSEWKYLPTDYHISKEENKNDQLIVAFRVQRNYYSYLYKIGLIMLMLSLLTNGLYALDPIEFLGDRLGFGVTILLTDVAYIIIINDKLPSLPYLTLIEWYIIAIFSYITFVLIFIAFNFGFNIISDLLACYFSILIWMILHTYYILNLIFKVLPEEEKKIYEKVYEAADFIKNDADFDFISVKAKKDN